MATEWELPHLKTSFRLGAKDPHPEAQRWYDVKFYPYDPPDADPVFALVGWSRIVVCRCEKSDSKSPIKIIASMTELSQESLNSCAWTFDPKTKEPLLCVAGTSPDKSSLGANIKILNVRTGLLVQTLIGHGLDINDLVISPRNPRLLASASVDHSIRLWNLDPDYSHDPCVVMFSGQGHREGVLTISFSLNGQYLLSGGFDHAVCLWHVPQTLPPPPPCSEAQATGHRPTTTNDQMDVNQNSTIEDKTTETMLTQHYPHFITTAVHSNFVDCVAFHDSLILSRAAEEHKIVLWLIDGFSVSSPPPRAAPTTHTFRQTRSAFSSNDKPQYQRLMTFDTPSSAVFYMRFSLLQQPNLHPVLAFGNGNSKVMFWDLQRFRDQPDLRPPSSQKGGKKTTDVFLHPPTSTTTSTPSRSTTTGPTNTLIPRHPPTSNFTTYTRETSTASTSTTTDSLTHSLPLTRGLNHRPHSTSSAPVKRESDIANPWKRIKPHREQNIPKMAFTLRGVAWSVDGEWLVSCGDFGTVGVWGRGW